MGVAVRHRLEVEVREDPVRTTTVKLVNVEEGMTIMIVGTAGVGMETVIVIVIVIGEEIGTRWRMRGRDVKSRNVRGSAGMIVIGIGIEIGIQMEIGTEVTAIGTMIGIGGIVAEMKRIVDERRVCALLGN